MVDRTHLNDETRDENPGAGEQVGEGVGGIGGVLAGAGLGSVAGPIGTIVGGLAGAVGGWWAGEKVGRAVEDMGDHEPHYQEHYRAQGRDDIEYDDARVGYGVGHIAGRHPDYQGRQFDEVEPTLRDNWGGDRHDYDTMRPYVREGFERTARGRAR